MQSQPAYTKGDSLTYAGDSYQAFGRNIQVVGFKKGLARIIDAEAALKLRGELNSLDLTPSRKPNGNKDVKCSGSDYCLDMNGIEHLSTDAMGELIGFDRKHAIARTLHIALVGLNPKIRNIFAITNFDRVMDVYDSVQQMLEKPRQ